MGKKAEQAKERDENAIKQRKTVYQGKFLSLQQEITKGKQNPFDFISHPGSVAIIPIDQQNRVIFIRQWRKAAGKILVELPAGLLEEGKSPQEQARKELREETGFDAKKLTSLGGFFTTPGFCNEYIHLFLAEELFFSPLQEEDTDSIDLYPIAREQIPQLIRQGQIIDAKTLAALFLYQNY
jgi:ADP-ribose pyrophosphatase